MASAAGVAFWDQSSCLSLHPKYGPWFALRAVVVFDGIEYTGECSTVLPLGILLLNSRTATMHDDASLAVTVWLATLKI